MKINIVSQELVHENQLDFSGVTHLKQKQQFLQGAQDLMSSFSCTKEKTKKKKYHGRLKLVAIVFGFAIFYFNTFS